MWEVRALEKSTEGFGVAVDGEHAPAAPEKFRRVASLTAAKINGEARRGRRGFTFKSFEREEEGIARGLA